MHARAAAALLACALLAAPAAAQRDSLRTQVVAAYPLHAAVHFLAAEYERTAGGSATLGVGAAYFALGRRDDVVRYAAVDVKARYYPGADPLRGVSLALTAGPSWLKFGDDYARNLRWARGVGIGAEVARSHLLGAEQRVHVGYGAGAKRLFWMDEVGAKVVVVPSVRLSVGYAY